MFLFNMLGYVFYDIKFRRELDRERIILDDKLI